jgi:predicted enzyme related to lactoylglutathione lyase
MARVVHFEIHADEPERAIEFYQSALGWEFSKWGGSGEYWLIITGTVQVESIDEIASKVERSGGKVSIPKFSVPGVGWVGYFEDTEGNTFGALEPLEHPEAH